MTVEREPTSTSGDRQDAAPAIPELERPRTWILPLLFLLLITVPAVILVLSNTDSREVSFAGWTGEAPLWIILAIAFVAGALLTRVVGWTWGKIRRRARRKKAEYDRARASAG